MSTISQRGGDFVIPAIDIINGKAVRLTQGDYSRQTIYNENPLEVAKAFEAAGLGRLHLVDLDGARSGKLQNQKILEAIADNTQLQIDFGGGVSSRLDVESILNAGAEKVTIGSLAVKQPQLLQEWVSEFGPETFFIGADVYNDRIKISGWLKDGGIGIDDFLKEMTNIGINNFFCTDIRMDGRLQGTSVGLYKNILAAFPGISLTASGGVACIGDIVLANNVGCSAVIVGKAIYEGRVSLQELEQLNLSLFNNRNAL